MNKVSMINQEVDDSKKFLEIPRKQDTDFLFTGSNAAWARMDQQSRPINSWGTIWKKLGHINMDAVAPYGQNERRVNNLQELT